MIIVLLLVLAGVGFVYAARYRRAHVMATGSVRVGDHQGPAMSPVGRWSLIVLAGALLVWSVTFATLPIYYAAVLAGIAFMLAVVAVVRYHDRSPLLLIPLVLVPLSAAFSAAFVLLQ